MSVAPANVGFQSSTSSSSDIADRNTKRRRKVSNAQAAVVCALNGSRRPQRRPRAANKRGSAHEVRMLRAQVASMEEELRGLKLKWTATLPDENTLAAAYRATLKKYAVIQTETTRRELQQMLLQQKLFFATLQTAAQRAPLYSTRKNIHDMIHFGTHLGRDSTDREDMLKAHYKRAIATLPAIMNSITKVGVDEDPSQQVEGPSGADMMPLSHMEIAGCEGGTLISSVFMSEIPHTTLEEAYAGVLAFFDSIPTWMKHHFGINTTHTRLNRPDSPIIYWRSTLDGGGLPATVNHIVCSELTPSHGMLHMDAITNDPLNPIPRTCPLEYGICGLTITPSKGAITGRATSVTLRWAAVYRNKLMPNMTQRSSKT
ncbi:hypothetical protein PRIC1_005846 [Phytophthora ramorum]